MFISQFSAVLFDMDGLMLNSETIYHAAWQETIAALGYTLDRQLYVDLVGRSNAESERLMRQAFGEAFPMETFCQQWPQRWRERVQAQGMPLQPGLIELLDFLESIDLPKAVGTSSNREEAELSLKSTGLWERFSVVVTVDDVAEGKPAPDIFLRAAQQLGHKPSACLVLEDSNAGVQAATTAGSQVIMVPDLQVPSEPSKTQALQICTSLHDVRTLLESDEFSVKAKKSG